MPQPRPMIANLSLFLAATAALQVACSQAPPPEPEAINVNPASLQEAVASIAAINRLQQANPQDPRSVEALRKLQPRLDQLNHLVARVEVAPGHTVDFFEPSPGVLGLSEAGPQHGERLVREEDLKALSVVALYRKLVGGAEAPAALVEAEKRQLAYRAPDLQADRPPGELSASSSIESSATELPSTEGAGVEHVSSALTGADGAYFTNNVCYTRGDSRGCFPNWGGGGYVDGWTKGSFLVVAPYTPGTVSVSLRYEDSLRFTGPVFQGQLASYSWLSSKTWDCCGLCACGTSHYDYRHHRWDISAAGIGFHWSYEYKSSCWDSDCTYP